MMIDVIPRNTERTINDIAIPKLSAISPNPNAKNEAIIVLNNDCTEITDVRSLFGTFSEIYPVNIGFLMFSTKYIIIKAISDNTHIL